MENDGDDGSFGSHWEKTIIENEIMVGTSINHDAAFSVFTMAVLKDTNWYTINNESRVDPIFWGKGKGCDFVTKACQGTSFDEFS